MPQYARERDVLCGLNEGAPKVGPRRRATPGPVLLKRFSERADGDKPKDKFLEVINVGERTHAVISCVLVRTDKKKRTCQQQNTIIRVIATKQGIFPPYTVLER